MNDKNNTKVTHITEPKKHHFATPVLDVFGESPFDKFVEHAHIIDQATKRLHKMLNNFTSGNFQHSEQELEEILDLAIQADNIKQYLITHITKHLIMPIGREELLLLIRGQDRIAAHAYNVAFQLDVRHTIVPKTIRKHMDAHIDTVAQCVETLLEAEQEVQRVLSAAFSHKSVARLVEFTNKGLELERNADHLKEKAIKSIFQESESLGLLGVYHLLKIVELVDRIAHHSKHTGIRLASEVAK